MDMDDHTVLAKDARKRRNGKKPTRELREFKFVIQPVLAIVDGDKVVGEQVADAKALYGLGQLQEFIDSFPANLVALNAELAAQ